jgi:uncharacterized protein YqeY
MTILDDIKDAKLRAMKRRDETINNILGLVIGQIQQGNDSSDDTVIRVCQKLIKSNDETIAALKEVNDQSSRQETLQNENHLLKSFLPRSWTETEIINTIKVKALDVRGAPSEGAAIGLVTKTLRELSKAPFDGKVVREIVVSLRRDAS